jgi:TolA-binding protein
VRTSPGGNRDVSDGTEAARQRGDGVPDEGGRARRGRSLLAVVLAGASALAGAGALPGCGTSSDREAMRHDIADLKTKLDAIDKRDVEYKAQVVRLKKVLDDATALLARNSADVGAKAAKNESDIAALVGRIEEINHNLEQQTRQADDARARLAAIEQTQGKIGDKVGLNMPEDKDQLWAQAGQRLGSGQRDEGRRFYRTFIQRFPQDARAPQAYLAIGQSFSQESKFPYAAAEFQKILDNYASSPEVPEAMWQLALTFTQLKFCSDARALLGDLVKRFPKSQRAGDAKSQLKQIGKLPKGACTS